MLCCDFLFVVIFAQDSTFLSNPMLLVLRYFGFTWDAVLEAPAPPAPVWELGRRERAQVESVVESFVESGEVMPPKAVTGIQATIATWLGVFYYKTL